MSTVQALTELSHRADEVAAFCRETGEPIQVTHLAGDDLVLMSVEAYRRQRELAVSEARRQAAEEARRQGLGLNAGHDLSLENLRYYVERIPWTDEVSIGHALISDALYYGLENTVGLYLRELKNVRG